jgi:hypothetical protein
MACSNGFLLHLVYILIKGAKVFQIEMFLNTEDHSKPKSLAVKIVVQHMINAV